MERFKVWLLREMAQVRKISPEEAKSKGMFGPVFHGTTTDNRSAIEQQGFKVFKQLPRQGNVSHGYLKRDDYHEGPPPIHHMGFGIYFTTKNSVAKQFNNGGFGLKPYYIHAPRMETINFGAPRTMMKWWKANGYTGRPNMTEDEWLQATENLTNTLSSKYDAIWFKGKGLRTLLDGDQVVVFNPDNIFEIDNQLSPGYDNGTGVTIKPGDRILLKGTRITTKILDMKPTRSGSLWEDVLGPSAFDLAVKIKPQEIEQLKSIYLEPLKRSLGQKHMEDVALKNRVEQMGMEQAVESYATYLFNVLSYSIPSAFVSRTLKPRERLALSV